VHEECVLITYGQLLPAPSHLLSAPHHKLIMLETPLTEFSKGEWRSGCD